jgi:hypothetical protein
VVVDEPDELRPPPTITVQLEVVALRTQWVDGAPDAIDEFGFVDRGVEDPTAGTGSGAWVASGIDPLDELSAKYIVFGASFDADGNPLDTADTRVYSRWLAAEKTD